MRGSPHAAPVQDRLTRHADFLAKSKRVLSQWLEVQKAWVHFQKVFSSADIHRQMPTEAAKFDLVDDHWRTVAALCQRENLAHKAFKDDRVTTRLEEAEAVLEDIRNGVAEYLRRKRQAFPRFFFLSNDEILEILSETDDPMRVLPHLSKCFAGIDTLLFDNETLSQAEAKRAGMAVAAIAKGGIQDEETKAADEAASRDRSKVESVDGWGRGRLDSDSSMLDSGSSKPGKARVVSSMVAKSREALLLRKPVDTTASRGAVEAWLS